MKIPSLENKRHSVPGNSDLFGTLHYTKNINLDEEGYIRLAPRTVSLVSEEVETDLGLPIAFGRSIPSANKTDFNIVTSEEPFTLEMAADEITIGEDSGTDKPTLGFGSHGRWFRNLWTVTDSTTNFFTKDTTAVSSDWDDQGNLANSGKPHPIEVFRNRDTICIGDGNLVKQYGSDASYTATTTLTLPVDHEVIALSYSNYRMGVLTQLSATANGQNQETFFFVWKGDSTQASQGIGTGSDRCFAVAAYRGSWVILTRAGQLLFFNGGGWEELVSLPFYYQKMLFGTSNNRDMYGDLMIVDGSVIYLNFTGLMDNHGPRYEHYLPSNPGGILCYDPRIGLYQRFSHSISPVSMITVTEADVDTATGVMTSTAGTLPATGNPVKYTSSKSDQIGGLQTSKIYYIIKHSATTFSLAATKEDALNAVKIALTTNGAANNYFLALDVYDYGVTVAGLAGGMAQIGINNGLSDTLIFGNELADFNSTTLYNRVNLIANDFENRGYFVTPKINSLTLEDTFQQLNLKHRPLKPNDKIIVKYKFKDLLGLPVSTPQGLATSSLNECAWTSDTVFTTTDDLSSAKTAFNDGVALECEVIGGAGAGVLVKITDLTESAGTYTVTVEEAVDGAAASRFCDVLIENWEKIGEITSANTVGYREFVAPKTSPWIKYKIELRGVDTAIEEMEIINTKHR
jgi:hypothetical protein